MTTLAQFDAATQERATEIFNQLTLQYRVAPNLFTAPEIGAAVRIALDAGEARFHDELWSALLAILHRRMADYAARGEELPSGLDAKQKAQLRKGLIARFGPLPDAAPEPEEPAAEEPDPPADARAPGEVVADILRARRGEPAPIDPDVLAVLGRDR